MAITRESNYSAKEIPIISPSRNSVRRFASCGKILAAPLFSLWVRSFRRGRNSGWRLWNFSDFRPCRVHAGTFLSRVESGPRAALRGPTRRRPTNSTLLHLSMPGATTERDVRLLRSRLGRAAPLERAVHDRVHLVEPPARARRPARADAAAGLHVAVLFKTQFDLLVIHARTVRAGVGQRRGGVRQIPKNKSQRNSDPNAQTSNETRENVQGLIGVWNLELVWALGFGIWNLIFAAASPRPPPPPKPAPTGLRAR